MIINDQVRAGIGIGLLGGFIGLGVPLSAALYRTTLWAAAKRIIKGFFWMLAARNLYGIAELIKFDDAPVSSRKDSQDTNPVGVPDIDAVRKLAINWAWIGNLIGVFVAIVLLSINFPESLGDGSIFSNIFWGGMLAGGGAMVCAFYGLAFGLILAKGIFRRYVLIGFFAGLMIGMLVVIAIGPPRRQPAWITYVLLAMMPATAGMICGAAAAADWREKGRIIVEDDENDVIFHDAESNDRTLRQVVVKEQTESPSALHVFLMILSIMVCLGPLCALYFNFLSLPGEPDVREMKLAEQVEVTERSKFAVEVKDGIWRLVPVPDEQSKDDPTIESDSQLPQTMKP